MEAPKIEFISTGQGITGRYRIRLSGREGLFEIEGEGFTIYEALRDLVTNLEEYF